MSPRLRCRYDGPESTALCLPENKCKEVCKGTEGCYGPPRNL